MRLRQKGMFFLLLILLLAGTGRNVQAAGSTFNLVETVKSQTTKAGTWVKSAAGYRYRYTGTKKYAKNTWLLVKKKIYFVNKKGIRVTGFKKYKKNTYYLDSKGRLVYGWQTINGEKYYFNKDTGAMAVGWTTIAKKQYYFSETGILQKDTWIGTQYVNKNGCLKKAKRIFVGDSRTVGLQQTINNEDTYIAKWGQGYNWFSTTGRGLLETELKAYPYSAVILNLGVNDLGNAELYLALYQELQAAYPNARFYFMAVNPVEETFLRSSGYGSRDNASIEAFNEKMQQAFGSRFIDTYHWMIDQEYVLDLPGGHGTTDGLHYINIVYQMLYGYVTARVK